MHTSLHNRPLSAISPWELKGKDTSFHSHSWELNNWSIGSQDPARHPSTATKYCSNLALPCPPSASPNSLDHGLPVCLQSTSNFASMFTWSWPPRASLNSVDYVRQVNTIMASKSISPNSLYHGIQEHLKIQLITASQCISNLARLLPPGWFVYGHPAHLHTRFMTILKRISAFTPSRPPSISPIPFNYHLQRHHQVIECNSESQKRFIEISKDVWEELV